jgi:hypothetical protein
MVPPNGSRLSCGRSDNWRKEAQPLIQPDGEATQFFPEVTAPPTSRAC